jgi:hypothetical protein
MRAGIIFAVAGAVCAQSLPDPTDVLAHARDRLLERRHRLPNYTCAQNVDRQYLRPFVQPQPAPSCREMREGEKSADSLQLYLTDRLRLDVKVSHGNEIGSWAGASQFDSRSIFDLVGSGPFGTGALGTFLTDIFTEGSASFEYDGEKPAGRGESYEYSFRVPLGASHYSVEVGHDWHAVGYEGLVRIDPQSFDLRYLLVRANELPPESETCEAVTSVDYDRVQIGTGNFLLPQRSRLHILMTDSTESDITTTYAACREYHGEATIHFEDEPAAIKTVQKGDVTAPVTLPVGLPVSLALASSIDTETAAAGDVLMEKVRKAVRANRSDDVLIPEGATVRCRIVKMRHWLDSPHRFEIAIRLETWEAGGLSTPIYAKPANVYEIVASQMHRRRIPIVLPPAGEPASVATFVFQTSRDRYVVPRGFESNWITIAAPPK